MSAKKNSVIVLEQNKTKLELIREKEQSVSSAVTTLLLTLLHGHVYAHVNFRNKLTGCNF